MSKKVLLIATALLFSSSAHAVDRYLPSEFRSTQGNLHGSQLTWCFFTTPGLVRNVMPCEDLPGGLS